MMSFLFVLSRSTAPVVCVTWKAILRLLEDDEFSACIAYSTQPSSLGFWLIMPTWFASLWSEERTSDLHCNDDATKCTCSDDASLIECWWCGGRNGRVDISFRPWSMYIQSSVKRHVTLVSNMETCHSRFARLVEYIHTNMEISRGVF